MKICKYRVFLFLLMLGLIGILSFRSFKEMEFDPKKIAQNLETSFKDLPPIDLSYLQSKRFFYLGQGQRCIAFVSEDDRYVIKFFKTESMFKEKSFSFKAMKHLFRSRQTPSNSMQKVLHEMKNYYECYQNIPDITALIDLHLNTSNPKYPSITLVDQKGRSFEIDLNQTCFVAQKKAILFKDKIKNAKSEEEKQRIVASMRRFLKHRAILGYSEKIKSLSMERNYGFVDDVPVQFDVGNVCYFSEIKNDPQSEFSIMEQMFNRWLKKNI